MSTATTKTPAAGPLREQLAPVYPIPLIEASCRTIEALAALKTSGIPMGQFAIDELAQAAGIAARIIRDGLSSHELAAKEGRSRG